MYVKRHLNWTDVGSCTLLTALGSAAVWRTIHPKSILILVTVLMLAEIIVQLRWRMSLPCPQCGFDPLLYQRNPDLAAKRVRQFFEQRKLRADFLLTSQALIETQKRISGSSSRTEGNGTEVRRPSVPPEVAKSGQVLSRTI